MKVSVYDMERPNVFPHFWYRLTLLTWSYVKETSLFTRLSLKCISQKKIMFKICPLHVSNFCIDYVMLRHLVLYKLRFINHDTFSRSVNSPTNDLNERVTNMLYDSNITHRIFLKWATIYTYDLHINGVTWHEQYSTTEFMKIFQKAFRKNVCFPYFTIEFPSALMHISAKISKYFYVCFFNKAC